MASAVVYRVLSRAFEARDEELARGAAPSPLSIDEVTTTSHRWAPERTSTRRPWQTTEEDGRSLRRPQPRRPQRLEPAHQNSHEGRMVLKRVDMAEYRRGAGLRPKRSRRGKELYLQDTRRSLQNPAAPDAAQRSLATPRRYSRGALYRLWLLRRGFASCQRARIGFCIPGRPRTSAIRLCHGGETQVLSSTGKRAGSSAFQRLRRGGSAGLRPRRGHLSSAGVPPQWWAEVFCGVFDYGGEEAAVSAEPPLPAAADASVFSLASFCASLQRRRGPPVPLASDVASLRALPPGKAEGQCLEAPWSLIYT